MIKVYKYNIIILYKRIYDLKSLLISIKYSFNEFINAEELRSTYYYC